MNPQLGWWPFGSLFGMAPAQLSQPILPDWSLQHVDVNFAGDADVEKDVVARVASYGRQLGVLTDAVLALAGDPPEPGKDPLNRLRDIATRISAVKAEHADALADRAREALKRLQKHDAGAARRIAAEFTPSRASESTSG
jgi:hypothetical protein